MELLHTFSQKIPMASLFLSVAAGYWIGNFSLGGMAGTLLVAVVIGQVGVPVDPVVKDMMFALLKQIYGHRKSLGQFLWILFYHPKKRRLSPLFQNSL